MVSTIWRHRESLGEAEFQRQRSKIELWLDRLLVEPRDQPGDRATRQLSANAEVLCWAACMTRRPSRVVAARRGGIARKVSHGNKTEAGKVAWERLTSLAATCHQRGVDFTFWLAAALPLDAPAAAVPTPSR